MNWINILAIVQKNIFSKLILNIEIHTDYSLAPEKIEIKREMLSKYQLLNADFYNNSISNVKKLVPNFFDKEKYVFHHENLQLYLKLGLKLKKMHCVLEFK